MNIHGSLKLIEDQLKNTIDTDRIKYLNQKKSEYESELRRLNKLQWEEDTQRVNIDDDR